MDHERDDHERGVVARNRRATRGALTDMNPNILAAVFILRRIRAPSFISAILRSPCIKENVLSSGRPAFEVKKHRHERKSSVCLDDLKVTF